MAPDAILQILRVTMLPQYAGRRVVVTPVACVFQQGGRMACNARSCRTPRRSMVQRKGMRTSVCRRLPAAGVMAFGTILSEHTLMRVLLLVTGITCRRRAFEYLVQMAGGTSHRYVFPG